MKGMKLRYIFFLSFIIYFSKTNGQLSQAYKYSFNGNIKNLSLKEYSIYVQKEKGLYNLLDNNVFDSKKIKSFCVSPLGNEILIIEDGKVGIYKLSKEIKKSEEIKFVFETEIKKIIPNSYGTKYFILLESGKFFSVTSDLKIRQEFQRKKIKDMAWSNNLSSLYLITQEELLTRDQSNNIKSKPLNTNSTVIHIADNSFEVFIGDSTGTVYRINQDLSGEYQKIKVSNSSIQSIVSHQEDPHVFVANSKGLIFSINTISQNIDSIKTKGTNKFFLSSIFTKVGKKKNEFILSHGFKDGIVIWDAKKFDPNFIKYVDDELSKFKQDYFKIKDGETENAFLKRTNPNVSTKIFNFEKQRITDSIADSKVVGKKNLSLEGGKLVANIDPFGSVEINSNDNVLLQYLNISEVHYSVNSKNGFDIKSVKVDNKIDGTILVFDPVLEKRVQDSLQRVEAARLEEEKKAIALAQQISRQELQLKNNLTSLVQNLKAEGKINEVDLSVESKLVKENDSTGKEELNLKINFVSKGVKAKVGANTSDYPPGKYNLLESPSAKTLVEFFIKSTGENLSQYLENGTRVTFKLTGSTDKSRIAGSIPYNGEFGEFKNFPYYFQGSLNGMILNTIEGIKANNQLGFLRTYSVRNFIQNFTDLFDSTKNKFIHYAEESDKLGAEYRKIQIEMTIHSIDKLMALNNDNNIQLSAVDTDIPDSGRKVEGYAIVIGNEDYASYQSDLDTSQNVPFAAQDAESFKNYLNQMYGIPKENILMLINATYGEMAQSISKFKKLMEFDGEGKNFVFYYSGHGMPHEQTNDPYIMPVDISGYTVDQAISLNNLLKDFSSFNYDSCTLVIDACFSGLSRSPEPLIKIKGVGKWKVKKSKTSTRSFYDFDISSLVKSEKKKNNYINPNLGDKMVIFSSSSGDETSLTDEKNQHGLFTYHFLNKLKETKGAVNIDELRQYLKSKVGVESIMKFNKKQTPEAIFGKSINKESLIFD